MKLYDLQKKIDILPGDVIGTRGPWLSPALMTAWREGGPIEALFQRRLATHVLMCTGLRRYVEATLPVVREFSAKEQNDDVVFVARFRPLSVDKAMGFMESKIGAKYDLEAWGASYGIGRQSKRKWYCSELVAAGVVAGGYPVDAAWKICCYPSDIQYTAEGAGLVVWRSYKKWWK